VAAAQLHAAGFNVDLQVTEWASVLDRRSRPADWDVFVTGGGFSIVPDPGMNVSFSPTYPGWWDTPTKAALLAQFLGETDPGKRFKLWAQLQALTYSEVPFIVIGGFSTLNMSRKGLPGFRSLYWIVPWGVQVVK
jgi:peptide/nickel transport system substrate-binding protein